MIEKLFRKKTVPPVPWDRENLEPAVRASICTGEKAAGFNDKRSGRFTEIALIRSEKDLEDFKARYGIEGDIKTIY